MINRPGSVTLGENGSISAAPDRVDSIPNLRIFMDVLKGRKLEDIADERALTPVSIQLRVRRTMNMLLAVFDDRAPEAFIQEPFKFSEYWYNLLNNYLIKSRLSSPGSEEYRFFLYYQTLTQVERNRLRYELDKLEQRMRTEKEARDNRGKKKNESESKKPHWYKNENV